MPKQQKQQQRHERTQRAVEETGDVERSPDTQKMTNHNRREVNRNQVEEAAESTAVHAASGDEGLIDAGTSHREPTERDRRAVDETDTAHTPKRGEAYRCEKCGMELKVTADCHCDAADHVHLECCGQELARA